jgi:hypothetical protein
MLASWMFFRNIYKFKTGASNGANIPRSVKLCGYFITCLIEVWFILSDFMKYRKSVSSTCNDHSSSARC